MLQCCRELHRTNIKYTLLKVDIPIFTYLFIRKLLIEAGHTSISLSIYSNPLLLAWFTGLQLGFCLFPTDFSWSFSWSAIKIVWKPQGTPETWGDSRYGSFICICKMLKCCKMQKRQNPVTVNSFLFAVLFFSLHH